MRNTFKRWVSWLSIIALFSFLLVACNSQTEDGSNNSEDTPPPTLAATAVPLATEPTLAPTNTPSQAEAVADDSSNSANTESETISETINESGNGVAGSDWTADARLIPFDTFEFGYQMQTVTNGGTPQIIGLTIQSSKPLSTTIWIPEAIGVADAENMTQIKAGVFENNSYAFIPELGCIWSGDGAGNDEMLGFNATGFLSFNDQPDAEFVGMETVNGLETYAYTVGQNTLVTGFPTNAQIQEASGRFNVYPLPTGESLIVKSTITFVSSYNMLEENEGNNEGAADSVVSTFTSEIRNINQPLDIQIPTECLEQANNFPYPVMEGGQILASMPGVSSIRVSGSTLEDVATWYETAMVNDGWTLVNTLVLGPITNIDLERDSTKVTVSVAQDPSSGGIAVTFIGDS